MWGRLSSLPSLYIAGLNAVAGWKKLSQKSELGSDRSTILRFMKTFETVSESLPHKHISRHASKRKRSLEGELWQDLSGF